MTNISNSTKELLTSGNHSFSVKRDADLELLLLPSSKESLTVEVELAEPGAYVEIKGLAIASDTEELKTTILVEHLVENTASNQVIKSIGADEASISVISKIVIVDGADNTEAHLLNKNILLSDTAKVEAKPELEIDHDNVICTHGSATGQLDEEALFYLTSRGISRKDASKLLLEAFVKDILEDEPQEQEYLTKLQELL